jgi:folylpolyglutamate synthase
MNVLTNSPYVPRAVDCRIHADVFYQNRPLIIAQAAPATVKLGLNGAFQHVNAGLAVALAKEWLIKAGRLSEDAVLNWEQLPIEFQNGLSKCFWPGRCQVWSSPMRPNITFYLDGAHTMESMEVCGKWFFNRVEDHREHSLTLLFNCSHNRNALALLKPLVEVEMSCKRFLPV